MEQLTNMTGATSLHLESLSLYHFLCQHIVGTEETVRTKRLMTMIRDNLTSRKSLTKITSGSFGEGLELKGSDEDIMYVLQDHIVHEEAEEVKFDPAKQNLVMETHDTKPGFAFLRYVTLPKSELLVKLGRFHGKSWYMSSEMVRKYAINAAKQHVFTKMHGPCVTTDEESVDLAVCVHNPNWIKSAENWMNRGNLSWPSNDVKSDIIDHGVLLVPIGCKGSDNEALEWRISFSVAERLLIYSFCHTQLLCYALMKILLKDLINTNDNIKHILCSYFIKTIIFWVLEDTAVDEWKPENLIRCFMKCFRRLLYTVEYSMCPHYFIPTINMFENKIEGQSRHLILEHLKSLFSYGWRCVLLSEQFRNFQIQSNVLRCTTEVKQLQLQNLVTSKVICNDFSIIYCLDTYRRCIGHLATTQSSFIKTIYHRNLSLICSIVMQSSSARSTHTNKDSYYQYRKVQSYVLQNVNHDAVSGWIMLAALFYNLKQYSRALYILNDVLIKCTPEKVYHTQYLSQLQMNHLKSTTSSKSTFFRVLKHCVMHALFFMDRSPLIPEELVLDVARYSNNMSPVLFVHFLCFLCHFHLNDRQQLYESIKDLQRTIDDSYFILNETEKGQGYTMLGIVLQLVKQNELAAQAFTTAMECDNKYNSAALRFVMMTISSDTKICFI